MSAIKIFRKDIYPTRSLVDSAMKRIYPFIMAMFILQQMPTLIQAQPAINVGTGNTSTEKVNLITDRDAYIAGENLLFNLFLESGTNQDPNKQSRIAYLVLRSNHSRILSHLLKLENGQINGRIYLPDTLSTGIYQIVAFTNYMRNFGESCFFTKQIIIVNRFDNQLQNLYPKTNRTALMDFYPVDGSVFNGISNRMVVATNSNEIPPDAQVDVTDESNSSVASFSLESGTGSFLIAPGEGKSYTAVVHIDKNTVQKISIPSFRNTGYKLEMLEKGDTISFQIKAAADKGINHMVILINKDTTVYHRENLSFSTVSSIIRFDRNKLPQGLLKISLVDENGKLVMSRYYYNVENLLQLVNIQLQKDSFAVHEPVQLTLKMNALLSQTRNVELAVAVKEFNPIEISLPDDVQGQIDFLSNTSYLDYLANFHKTLLDNYLTICDYSSLPYHTPPAHRPSPTNYQVENSEVVINGSLTGDSIPIDRRCILVSTPDSFANLEYTFTDHQGNFQFLLNNYYLGKDLIIRPFDKMTSNTNEQISINDKFELHTDFHPMYPTMSRSTKEYLFHSQDIVQVQKVFGISYIHTWPSMVQDSSRIPYVYYQPTATYIPSNYVEMKDFKDIADNILQGFRFKMSGKSAEAYVFDYLTSAYFKEQPIIFLDGVPLDNPAALQPLGSAEIKKIDICSSLRTKGNLKFPGLVAVYSQDQKINSVDFQKPSLKYSFAGFSDKASFVIPDYSSGSPNSNIPDFRQTLYWNPQVHLTQKESMSITFSTSDYLGQYLVEVSGVTSDGKPVRTYTRIKVYNHN